MSKILVDRVVLEQALEALEFMADQWGFTHKANRPERWQAITALRAALAQEGQEQEPVAWLLTGGSDVYLASEFSPDSEHEQEWTPLYAGPPRREWKGLAEGEAMELMNDTANGYWADEAHIQDFSRAIEARLRKLNNT